ncbi:MAG: hypothetical protein LW688_12945 [Cryomorphaceae bacterium]|nr:hypothetical protein [Cryomorphaceae bacterium]
MKKFGLLCVLLIISMLSNAQFGLSGGVNMLKGFGGPKPYVGFHVVGEIPRDDFVSFMGKISFYAKQRDILSNTGYVEAVSPTTVPFYENVTYVNTMNYVVLEGGNRFYLGDGYDNGFGAYGGGTLQLIFNTVKREYDYSDIDMSKYQLPVNENVKGSIFSLGFGLTGGLKYTFAGYGTLYTEGGFSYIFNAQPSNTTASSGATNLYSSLFFTFGVGFRKEFY